MKKIHKLAKWTMHTLAIAIILLAIVIVILHVLTPYFNRHLPDIELLASETFQRPVKIEKVHLSWEKYEPALTLNHVSILDKDTYTPRINIQNIKITFNLIKSLWVRKPQLDKIKIIGIHLTVQEKTEGRLTLAGFYQIPVNDNFTGVSLKSNEIFDWIFTQKKLSLNNIEVQYIPYRGAEHTLLINRLKLNNDGTHHLIQGDILLRQETSTALELKIDWNGTIADLPHASANLYVYVEGISLPQWLAQYNWHDWQVSQGVGSAKIWGTWKDQAWQHLQTQFQFYDIIVNLQKYNQQKSISRLSGKIAWENQGVNQFIRGEDILLDFPEHLWPAFDFSATLVHTPTNGPTLKTLQLSYLDLKDTVDWLLVSHLLTDRQNQLLLAMQPKGEITQFMIDLPIDEELTVANLNVSGLLNAVSVNNWQAFPTIQMLSGQLNWNGKQGRFLVDSKDLSIDCATLFAHPLKFDKVYADVSFFRKENSEWAIEAEKLQLANSDLLFSTNFKLGLPATGTPVIQLKGDFSVAHAENLTQYLPTKTFSGDINDWFKQAFHGGQLTSGKISLEGNWQDYPFINHNGEFFIYAKAKNFELSYAPKWPRLRELNGEVLFNGATMTADANSALVYDVPLNHVHLTMTNVGTPGPTIITASGIIASDISKGLYFIHNSPLEKRIGEDLAAMTLSGPLQLNLGLVIPLAHPADTTIDGKSTISNVILSVPSWNFTIDRLYGDFRFTENKLEAKSLQGRLQNEAIQLGLSTQANSHNQKTVRADLHSQIEMSALSSWLNVPLTRFVQGKTAYYAQLDLTSKTDPVPSRLTLYTDLKGIAINIPPPFGKLPSVARNLKLELFIKAGQPLQTRIYYGDLLTAAMSGEKTATGFKWNAGEILLGAAEAHISTNDTGIKITGKLEQFDLNDWQEFLNSNNLDSTPSTSWWKSVNVNIGKLLAFGQELDQVQVQVARSPNALQIKLNNNLLNGQISLPDNKSLPIRASFDRLTVPEGLTDSHDDLNPKNLPSLSFEGKDVRYGDKQLGTVRFETIHTANGATIKDLTVISPDSVLHANGDWEMDGTHLVGNITSEHVNDLLKKWNFEATNLIATKGDLQFDLSWPNPPYKPDLSAMSGFFTIKLGPGQIINLSSANAVKIGVGRMLNILSLESLPRRLSLDFSDWAQKGYSFDYINGDFDLQEGNAFTQNMQINGPVAKIDIKGRIGFKVKDYALHMNIQPYVTSSLPIVVGVFNPIAGVATWVANKVIVNKEISKVATYKYKITGSWDDPVWEKM